MRPVGSKYLLEEPLGHGATGTVWRGRQRETAGEGTAEAARSGEVVAIKVLKEELANDSEVVMRFLRERTALLRLSHRNIVRVRDLVVEGDLLALVMDLVEGPDLHRYLHDNGPLTPVAAALVTAQIADALAASHADGVVHRDLKPANVLLASGGEGDDAEPRPLLTDFGIARLADSPRLTRTQMFVGTPAYVAPESAEGRPQTSAVDVYGAGALLYELVSGRPPFGGDSTLEVLQRHLTEEPPRLPTVPEPLWTVIERCLRKSPDERPSAESLARALRTVADGVRADATPEQARAALGVAGLLVPDSSPVAVPGTGGGTGAGGVGHAPAGAAGDAEPTQVLPRGSGTGGADDPRYDPNAATSVLPQGGTPAGPSDPDAAPTRAMPPVPPAPAAPAADGGAAPGEGEHPWRTQLRAARDRNEQTQVQPLDPSEDPLRRRPPRRPAPPRSAPEPQAAPQPAPQYSAPRSYAPPPPQPRHQRYEPEPSAGREPRQRREPRPPRQRTPIRIPGLGCLKGCLVMVVLLVVAATLIWNFTPVPEWWAEGKSWWQTVKGVYQDVTGWLGQLGGN